MSRRIMLAVVVGLLAGSLGAPPPIIPPAVMALRGTVLDLDDPGGLL